MRRAFLSVFLRYGDPTVVPVRRNQIDLTLADRSKDNILRPSGYEKAKNPVAPDVLRAAKALV